MADLRTLVERDMDRAGTPAYTFDDLSRRRDRKRRAQWVRMTAVALTIAALGIAGLIRAWDPAAPPTPASEGETPVAEKIAFVGQLWIGVIDADSGEVRWLPRGREEQASNPAWSPDGTRIAFSAAQWIFVEREGRPGLGFENRGIYVINVDGSDLVRLTPSKRRADDRLPAWSPDGTRIAFFRTDRQTGWPHVYVMNADGSGIRPLPFEHPHRASEGPVWADERLDWSSDGTEVILSTRPWDVSDDELVYDFDAFDVETGRRRRVAGPIVVPRSKWEAEPHAPVLSADGTRVAFVGEGGLYVADADGSGQKMIADGARIGEDGEWVPGALTWSPDGTRIAAFGVIGGQNDPDDWGLFAIDAEGTRLVRLNYDGLNDERPPPWPPWYTHPAWWSPPSSAEGP